MLQRSLWSLWDVLVTFLNSNFGVGFISALVGSAAGAWGGAYAAQRIADRARRRQLLLDEIRGCNAGIDAAGSVLNAFLNLKGRYLVEMKRDYEEQLGAVEVHKAGIDGGWIDARLKLHLRLDQETFPEVRVPLELLQKVMSERLTISGRPQGLASKIAQCVHLANDMITVRNAFIEELKGHPKEQHVPRVFALPMAEVGGEDRRFKGSVEGLWKYTNDVIYFSSELTKALTKYGRSNEERFRRKFGPLLLRTSEMMFDSEEWLRLQPNRGDYESWERTYVQLVSPTEGRRVGKWWYWLRKAVRRFLLKPWDRHGKTTKWKARDQP